MAIASLRFPAAINFDERRRIGYIGVRPRTVRAESDDMRGLRWWIAGLLMLATIVNYIDRQCLGVASTEIKADLEMDSETYSYVVSAFLITYGLMQPVMGRIMDWLGTRLGFMLAVS